MYEMKSTDRLKLATSLIVCQLAGLLGSLFTTPAISTWYQTLNKPSFTPPSWLFAPVWIGLYLLMGISLFLVWKKKEQDLRVNEALMIFFIQLILNAFWSIAFFGLRSPLLGLVDIIFLWMGILLTIQKFFKISRNGALLLLPYLLWVSFAALLNFSLWVLNR
jgi:tryptophan-rich sensory protein